MRNVLVIGTFMPPSRGHEYLIEFARNFAASTNDRVSGWQQVKPIKILINSRECEPINGLARFHALQSRFPNDSVYHYTKDVPQNPSEHPDFWNYWKELIQTTTGIQKGDIIVASEKYGVELANVLECEFIPCDVERQFHAISGTTIRHDILGHYDDIMDTMKPYFQFTTTFFGAESTGKSTCSKNTAAKMSAYETVGAKRIPEWAREYLEICGPEVTDHRMDMIVDGQYAAQMAAKKMSRTPFIIQDTDLLSTLGYYKIFCNGVYPEKVKDLFLKSKSDLYVVMPSENPFEQDILRYGGNVRESTDQFWIDLLEEFGCEYIKMPFMDKADQAMMVCEEILKRWDARHLEVAEFIRT